MNGIFANLAFAMRGRRARWLAAPVGVLLLALAACNGTAVVTMTSTASSDHFLAYRVTLVSVQLQSSGGKAGLSILPSATTVDFASLTDVSEVLGAAAAAKGSYQSALITLDYGSAQIVYDNGSLNGVTLTPVSANGRPLGQIKLTVNLDPSASLSISAKGASQLALDFKLAASNVVDLNAKTVTVTPVIAASSSPIDAKQVRIRGAVVGVAADSSSFTVGVMPFSSTGAGTGNLTIVPSAATTFEINGIASSAAGLSQLGSLSAGTLTVAYGTLTTSTTFETTAATGGSPFLGLAADGTATDGTTTDGTTVDGTTDGTVTDGAVNDGTVNDGSTAPTSVAVTTTTFTAAQVLAGSSVQGGGLDRLRGIVSARSGDTLTIEDGTLIGNDGTETFMGGTTFVIMGANTLVTLFGQGDGELNTVQQVSVGSSIDAFGVAASTSAGNATLDASAGRVRLNPSTVSGLVASQGSGTVTLNIATVDGRAVAPFDFAGSGANARQYSVATSALDSTNLTAGAPAIATGLASSFGAAPPNFTATSLLDPTTIDAQIVVDWGAGTAVPFTTYDTSAIDVDRRNGSLGVRHQIGVGAQVIDIAGLSSDPLIVPSSASSNIVYSISHALSATVENFNTYDAFIAQLQTELNGTALATGLTAVGQYTAATFSLAATSITLSLNN